jgi:5'(3')-deoxyribonucleotidase
MKTLSTWKQKKAHRKEYNAWVHVDREPFVFPDLQLTYYYNNNSKRLTESDSAATAVERSTAAVDQVKVEYELLRSIRGMFKGNINA